MKQESLRKLNRQQLLSIMLQQQETIEAHEERIRELTLALEQKEIILAKSGSIAEAALALNQVFEAAQKAADQYVLSVREMEKERIINGLN